MENTQITNKKPQFEKNKLSKLSLIITDILANITPVYFTANNTEYMLWPETKGHSIGLIQTKICLFIKNNNKWYLDIIICSNTRFDEDEGYDYTRGIEFDTSNNTLIDTNKILETETDEKLAFCFNDSEFPEEYRDALHMNTCTRDYDISYIPYILNYYSQILYRNIKGNGRYDVYGKLINDSD